MPKEPNAFVNQRIEVNPGLIKLRVIADGWEFPEFIPGQYTLLGLPWTSSRHSLADSADPMTPRNPHRMILRSYSMASSSRSRQYLEFYIVLVRSGLLSPRLFALEEGQRLFVSPNFQGMFTLNEVPAEFNLVLIATGTGVAPYMSMLRSQIGGNFRERMAVIHGAARVSDLGYHDELEKLDETYSGFNYIPVISRPDEESGAWAGEIGRVEKLWVENRVRVLWQVDLTPENTHIFLCGSPYMIEDMKEILGGQGFREHTERQEGQVHVEKYYLE